MSKARYIFSLFRLLKIIMTQLITSTFSPFSPINTDRQLEVQYSKPKSGFDFYWYEWMNECLLLSIKMTKFIPIGGMHRSEYMRI